MTVPVIVTIGELLVEFVSHKTNCGLEELADFSGPYPSGAPAICIDQAAQMGAKTKIYGGLGADSFGNALIERLQSHGVNTDNVLRLTDKTTGVAFVSYFSDGSRTFIFHLTNTAAVSLETLEIALPKGPIILHISGASLGNPKLRAAVETGVKAVLAQGGKISCDPNARAELMRDEAARQSLMTVMQQATYLFPSTSDLGFLYPDKTETQAVAHLQTYSAEIIALKRGAEGAVVFSNDQRIDIESFPVDEIDPTGAGDCFCGTFLAMITQGQTLEKTGRYASAAGALAVTKRGPMEGNSSPAMIEAFLATQNQRQTERSHEDDQHSHAD